MSVTTRRIAPEGKQLEDFLEVPGQVYRSDQRYCLERRSSVVASILRQCFVDTQLLLLTTEGSHCVARALARVAPMTVAGCDTKVGLLGFFEAVNHPAAVSSLFHEAMEWFEEQEASTVIGPVDGDTWHRYRVNLGPWEAPPFLLEPYNPPYYQQLWEDNGFSPLAGYYSKQVVDLPAVARALGPRLAVAQEQGYRFSILDISRFDSELDRLYRLSCVIFRDNLLYQKISREDFCNLYRGTRHLLDPELVIFATAPDGSDAGFLFAFPDRIRAVTAMQGRTGLWATCRYLLLRNATDAVNLKSLGVLPQHRGGGLATALMCSAYQRAEDKGYQKANLCLISDTNPSGRIDAGLGQLLRRYRLYHRVLAADTTQGV